MAKQIDNSYVGNAAGIPDFTSGLSRTNPQAHLANNMVKLYGVRKFGGCSFAPTWTYVYDESADTFTVTPTGSFNATGLRFWKYRIIDEDGTEVYGTQGSIGTNTAIVVNTSTLDPNKEWRLEFSAETLNAGLHCGASWWIEFPGGWGLADHSGSGQDI
jgi:hypothetical protein